MMALLKSLSVVCVLVIASLSPIIASAQSPEVPGVEQQYADVNGIRLHYATIGQGPLIVFLHGFPEFWYQWKAQLVEFGRDFQAVAPDMRGYNLSSSPTEVSQYRLKTLVEDVRALADHLGKRKFILVGHDWGGVVAWAFAMYYPERLEKLVILDAPHLGVFERELRENPAQQFESQYMLLFNTPDAEKVLMDKNYEGLIYHVLSDGLQKGYVTEADKEIYLKVWGDQHTLTGGLNYYRACRVGPPPKPGDEWSVQKHCAPDLKSYVVTVPTLVIWGIQDPYLQLGNLSGLSRYVPDMKTKLFPDAGHWVNRTKAKEVNQAIREFLGAAAQ
jgi:epoxide hydrolase 4